MLITALSVVLLMDARAQTNAWKTVTIGAVQGNLGLHTKCTINGQWVLVQGLPADITTTYHAYHKLNKETTDMAAWCDKEYKRIRTERAIGPQEADYDSPAGARIRALNIAALKLEEKQEELQDKQDALKVAMQKFKEASQIEAVETKQVYGGMRVWVARKRQAP